MKIITLVFLSLILISVLLNIRIFKCYDGIYISITTKRNINHYYYRDITYTYRVIKFKNQRNQPF